MTRARDQNGLGSRDLADRQRRAERHYQQVLAHGDPRDARIWQFACEQLIEHGNPGPYKCLVRLKRIPATIEEFIASDDYLGDFLDGESFDKIGSQRFILSLSGTLWEQEKRSFLG